MLFSHQIGAKNPSLQTLLDAMDAIKCKVCLPIQLHVFSVLLHANYWNKFSFMVHCVCVILQGAQTSFTNFDPTVLLLSLWITGRTWGLWPPLLCSRASHGSSASSQSASAQSRSCSRRNLYQYKHRCGIYKSHAYSEVWHLT